MVEGCKSSRATPRLKDNYFLAVHNCILHMLATTLHIWRSSLPSTHNLRACRVVVTGEPWNIVLHHQAACQKVLYFMFLCIPRIHINVLYSWWRMIIVWYEAIWIWNLTAGSLLPNKKGSSTTLINRLVQCLPNLPPYDPVWDLKLLPNWRTEPKISLTIYFLSCPVLTLKHSNKGITIPEKKTTNLGWIWLILDVTQ
jgi:hypothetical protein